MKISTSSFPVLLLFGFLFGGNLYAAHRYESETLVIKEITPNIFMHVSWLQTKSWGKVACNGMVFRNGNAAAVFDTPTDDSVSLELIQWINSELDCQVQAVVVNHFHVDCLGGLAAFHKKGIPSYANKMTIALAKANGNLPPQNGLKRKLKLKIGQEKVVLRYLGAGHTDDNTVAYVPSERALFGGCMIKSIGSGKGNLDDADVAAWPKSVARIKTQFPDIKYVIPGHGKAGSAELLDFTIQLFTDSPKKPTGTP